jgi:hypothetical protein
MIVNNEWALFIPTEAGRRLSDDRHWSRRRKQLL